MLDDNILKIIKTNLNSYLPKNYKAFIFGSRATNNNRPFSDIDLGIIGPKPLPSKNYVNLVQALEDSDIPYRTDVVDFANVNNNFKKQALAVTIAI